MGKSILVILDDEPTLRVCAIGAGRAFVFRGQRFAAETRTRFVFADRLLGRHGRLIGLQLDDGAPDWGGARVHGRVGPELIGFHRAREYVTLGSGGIRVWLERDTPERFQTGDDRMIVIASYLSDRGVFAAQLPAGAIAESELREPGGDDEVALVPG